MDQREVRVAWEKFVERGTLSADLRSSVAASWQRSRNHRITIDRAQAPLVEDAELFRRRCKHASLRHAARRALENSKIFLSDANSIMILTDPTGLIKPCIPTLAYKVPSGPDWMAPSPARRTSFHDALRYDFKPSSIFIHRASSEFRSTKQCLRADSSLEHRASAAWRVSNSTRMRTQIVPSLSVVRRIAGS